MLDCAPLHFEIGQRLAQNRKPVIGYDVRASRKATKPALLDGRLAVVAFP